MTLHDTVNAMLHDAQGFQKVNTVMRDVCNMMTENGDIDAIVTVLAYLGEDDAVAILTEE